MTPEPHRTSTLAGRFLLAVTLAVVAWGCTPVATLAVATDAPFGDLGPSTPELLVEVEADTPAAATAAIADDAENDEEPDGPQRQSEEARAAAYQENFDAARRYKAADRAKYPYGHGRRYRGHRGHGFAVGKFALVAVVGIVVLRVMFPGRKPATPPPTVGAPATSLAAVLPVVHASRQIISLACSRCDRVLDLPRDRASRRLFCPRCGAVMPSEA